MLEERRESWERRERCDAEEVPVEEEKCEGESEVREGEDKRLEPVPVPVPALALVLETERCAAVVGTGAECAFDTSVTFDAPFPVECGCGWG